VVSVRPTRRPNNIYISRPSPPWPDHNPTLCGLLDQPRCRLPMPGALASASGCVLVDRRRGCGRAGIDAPSQADQVSHHLSAAVVIERQTTRVSLTCSRLCRGWMPVWTKPRCSTKWLNNEQHAELRIPGNCAFKLRDEHLFRSHTVIMMCTMRHPWWAMIGRLVLQSKERFLVCARNSY
jgi:hypothetical protein